MQTEHSPFPTDETLAAYIDGRLDEETRKRVVEHMAECPECFDVVMGGREVLQTGLQHPPHFTRFHGARVAAISTLAVAAVLATVFFVVPLRDFVLHRRNGLAALSAVSLKERPAESRLSNFPYAPERIVTRGNKHTAVEDDDNWKLLEVATVVKDRSVREATPENLHALGVCHLLLGNYNEAVITLEKTIRQSTVSIDLSTAIRRSTDVPLLNDLAAAYLARGERLARTEDYASAILVVDHAWELSRTPEVAWNRAVAFERSQLTDDARLAWTEYLRLDASSRWATEARSKLERLNKPTISELWPSRYADLLKAAKVGDMHTVQRTVTEFPEQVRAALEFDILPALIDVQGKYDYGCDTIARAICTALERAGDHTYLPSIAALVQSQRMPLVRAYRNVSRGHERYAAGDISGATVEFTRAEATLKRIDPAAWRRVNIQLASCAYYAGRYAAASIYANAAMLDLDDPSDGMAHWLSGLISMAEGAPEGAIDHYRHALQIFEQYGEREHMCAVRSLLAEALDYAGNMRLADEYRRLALEDVAVTGLTRRAITVISEASEAAIRRGQIGLAMHLQNLVVTHARKEGDSHLLIDALLCRAALKIRNEQRATAQVDLNAARQLAQSLNDQALRSRAFADVALTEARFPGVLTARDLAGDALRYWSTTDNYLRVANAYVALADIAMNAKDAEAAEREYLAALAILERHSIGVKRDALTLSTVPNRERLCDELLRLALKRDDSLAAHDYVERRRYAVLDSYRMNADPSGDRRGLRPLEVSTISSVQQALPYDAVVVSLATDGQRVVVWTITRSRTLFRTTDVALVEVRASAQRFAAKALRPTQGAGAVDRDEFLLQRILLQDVPADSRRLIIVADDFLATIPYSALRSHSTGRYLVEDFSIRMAPAVGLAVQLRERQQATRQPDTLVAVAASGDKDNPETFLPSVSAEIAAVESFYHHQVVISGANCTRSRILAALPEATVIQYSGHASLSAGYPLYSTLDLNGPGVNPFVYAHEIVRLRLRNVRAVVLTACDSATPTTVSGEWGGFAIADAFLLSCHCDVIGTLKPLPDDNAPAFTVALHRRISSGLAADEALRQTQIEWICSSRSPAEWAMFVTYGSITNNGGRHAA
jgi:CHAT domain-containing protein